MIEFIVRGPVIGLIFMSLKISIFGLGYVGAVSGACLARQGHEVVGVDKNLDKVSLVQAGRSPIVEAGLEDLIARMAGAGRLRATTDPDTSTISITARAGAASVYAICVVGLNGLGEFCASDARASVGPAAVSCSVKRAINQSSLPALARSLPPRLSVPR